MNRFKKIVNLTHHPITVYVEGAAPERIPMSGSIAKVYEKRSDPKMLLGRIPVREVEWEEIHGLPAYDPNGDTCYIVTTRVARAVLDGDRPADDLLVQGFKHALHGRMLGCHFLEWVETAE